MIESKFFFLIRLLTNGGRSLLAILFFSIFFIMTTDIFSQGIVLSAFNKKNEKVKVKFKQNQLVELKLSKNLSDSIVQTDEMDAHVLDLRGDQLSVLIHKHSVFFKNEGKTLRSWKHASLVGDTSWININQLTQIKFLKNKDKYEETAAVLVFISILNFFMAPLYAELNEGKSSAYNYRLASMISTASFGTGLVLVVIGNSGKKYHFNPRKQY